MYLALQESMQQLLATHYVACVHVTTLNGS
jgi:hypothetical protein